MATQNVVKFDIWKDGRHASSKSVISTPPLLTCMHKKGSNSQTISILPTSSVLHHVVHSKKQVTNAGCDRFQSPTKHNTTNLACNAVQVRRFRSSSFSLDAFFLFLLQCLLSNMACSQESRNYTNRLRGAARFSSCFLLNRVYRWIEIWRTPPRDDQRAQQPTKQAALCRDFQSTPSMRQWRYLRS